MPPLLVGEAEGEDEGGGEVLMDPLGESEMEIDADTVCVIEDDDVGVVDADNEDVVDAATEVDCVGVMVTVVAGVNEVDTDDVTVRVDVNDTNTDVDTVTVDDAEKDGDAVRDDVAAGEWDGVGVTESEGVIEDGTVDVMVGVTDADGTTVKETAASNRSPSDPEPHRCSSTAMMLSPGRRVPTARDTL